MALGERIVAGAYLALMDDLASSACRASIAASLERCSSASLCSCFTSSSMRSGYPCADHQATHEPQHSRELFWEMATHVDLCFHVVLQLRRRGVAPACVPGHRSGDQQALRRGHTGQRCSEALCHGSLRDTHTHTR